MKSFVNCNNPFSSARAERRRLYNNSEKEQNGYCEKMVAHIAATISLIHSSRKRKIVPITDPEDFRFTRQKKCVVVYLYEGDDTTAEMRFHVSRQHTCSLGRASQPSLALDRRRRGSEDKDESSRPRERKRSEEEKRRRQEREEGERERGRERNCAEGSERGSTSLAGRSPFFVGPRKTPARRAAITQSPRLRLVRSSATAAILVPVSVRRLWFKISTVKVSSCAFHARSRSMRNPRAMSLSFGGFSHTKGGKYHDDDAARRKSSASTYCEFG